MKDAILKIKKTKTGIKKDLKNSIVNSKRIENVDIQDKVNGCISNEDTIKTIQEFEQIKELHRVVRLPSRPNMSEVYTIVRTIC